MPNIVVEGEEEYNTAYQLYRQQHKFHLKMLDLLKDRTDDASVAALTRQRESFSQQDSIYKAAKRKWKSQQLQNEFNNRVKVNPSFSLADLAKTEIDYANSGKKMEELFKRNNAVYGMSLEKTIEMAETALKYYGENPPAEAVQKITDWKAQLAAEQAQNMNGEL
jgi:hypothetical protein